MSRRSLNLDDTLYDYLLAHRCASTPCSRAARRDARASRGRHADRAGPGPVLRAAGPAIGAKRALEIGDVHRLQRARRRARRCPTTARSWPATSARSGRASAGGTGRRRASRTRSTCASRRRPRRSTKLLAEGGAGHVRLRVHRRRQARLRRLLRALPHARPRGRPDRDRQRAVERQRSRSRAEGCRHVALQALNAKLHATSASTSACCRSATASRWRASAERAPRNSVGTLGACAPSRQSGSEPSLERSGGGLRCRRPCGAGSA